MLGKTIKNILISTDANLICPTPWIQTVFKSIFRVIIHKVWRLLSSLFERSSFIIETNKLVSVG